MHYKQKLSLSLCLKKFLLGPLGSSDDLEKNMHQGICGATTFHTKMRNIGQSHSPAQETCRREKEAPSCSSELSGYNEMVSSHSLKKYPVHC
jgi:hypothetical protein